MKSFILVSIFLACLVGQLNAAAVEPISEQKEVQVEEEPIPEIIPECHQPKEVGRCFALFKRFAFNPETGRCVEFVYGGCAGNSNNFKTIEECQSKCMSLAGLEATTATEVEAEAEVEIEASSTAKAEGGSSAEKL